MSDRQFKSDCGCTATLIKWSSKRTMLSMKNCPLHKQAQDMLTILRMMVQDAEKCANPAARLYKYEDAKTVIGKVTQPPAVPADERKGAK